MSNKHSLNLVLIAALLASLGLSVLPVPSAHAATYTVTTTTDSGTGSLRQAILDANTNPSADNITFSLSGCPCTITLSSSLPDISEGLTIADPSTSGLTISGNNAVRAFTVDTGIMLNLQGLIVANSATGGGNGGGIYNNGGNVNITDSTFFNNRDFGAFGSGGGIYNDAGGIVNVTNSTFSNNSAGSGGGGIYNNGGMVIVANSTFSSNGSAPGGGGGIYNTGTLTVTHSTFSGNSAITGGGILSSGGSIAVSNTTFSGNSAMGGGGIYSVGGLVTVNNTTFSNNTASAFGSQGGGIINSGTLTVTNSTFSGNSSNGSGGGLWNSAVATATVINSTFSGNNSGSGGGIYNFNGGTVTLKNSILANSTSGGNCSGTTVNGGNNIDSGTTCAWGSASGSMSGIDPMLGSLQNNGGPTQTFALLAVSSAINAGDTMACPATDQRGMARPQNGTCDIGAYERGNPSAIAPTGGTPQSAAVGSIFPAPLQATVVDSVGGPLDGISVTFSGPVSGPGIVSGGVVNTNVSGIASFTATANLTAGGPYIVTATVGGFGFTANFSLTNGNVLFLPLVLKN